MKSIFISEKKIVEKEPFDSPKRSRVQLLPSKILKIEDMFDILEMFLFDSSAYELSDLLIGVKCEERLNEEEEGIHSFVHSTHLTTRTRFFSFDFYERRK
jgi:hypothetical protein